MRQLESDLLHFLQERGWDNLRPADVAKSIMIEGGELLEHFQWDSKSLQEIKANKQKLQAISEELADVLIYSIELSVLLGLDTEQIIRTKLEKATQKYPAQLMKEQSQVGTSDVYWKIKQEHRKNN